MVLLLSKTPVEYVISYCSIGAKAILSHVHRIDKWKEMESVGTQYFLITHNCRLLFIIIIASVPYIHTKLCSSGSLIISRYLYTHNGHLTYIQHTVSFIMKKLFIMTQAAMIPWMSMAYILYTKASLLQQYMLRE